MSAWFKQFHGLWPIPENYLCVDVETSGFSPRNDYLCTAGWAVVANRQVPSTGYVVLNWFLAPALDAPAFEQDLLKVEASLKEKGKNFFHSAGYLKQFGVQPQEGLRLLQQTLLGARDAGYPLVGYNAYNFDAEFIQAHILDFLQT